MRLARLFSSAAATLALAAISGAARAQQPAAEQGGDRFLVVHVTDSSTGTGVADAEVWVGGTRASTDSVGNALLPLRHDHETVVVRRLGYGDARREVSTNPGSLEVALEPAPLALNGVAARTRAMPMSPSLRRFYERMEHGRGSFVTRELIDRRKPRRLTDLFREIPGVRVASTSRGDRLVMTGATPAMYRVDPRWEAGDCPVQYYLDGVSYQPDFAGVPNDVRPDEVEGIEVYRRLSEVPVEFRRPGAECGVVVIWLKERG